MPVWNRVTLVERSIRCTLAQTIPDLELVITDNASTDGTWELLQKIASEDARIKLFRNDSNIGDVRNCARAVDEAKGQFGKFLFSDDLISPDFLEKTLPRLADPEVGIVWTGAESFDTDSGAILGRFHTHNQDGLSSASFIRQTLGIDADPFGLHGPTTGMPNSPICALSRMSDVRHAWRKDVHGMGADTLFYLLTVAKYPRVAHVPEILSQFGSHPASYTVSSKADELAIRYRVAKTLFVDGPGRAFVSAKELARFNAESELLCRKHNGAQYGIRSWRDFHASGVNPGELDSEYLLPRLADAIKERRAMHPDAQPSAEEEVLDQLALANARNGILSQRLSSLVNPWTWLGWRLMPWTKPAWRKHPLDI